MRWLALVLAFFAFAAPAAAQKRIAFSFDDVPRRPGAFMTADQRTERLIAALRRSGVRQAAFFLTPGHLEEPYGTGGEARIAAYVRAGHVIANHSWSHRWLSRIGAEAYLADLDRASVWLAGRRGARPWFRYPYLDEGNRQGAEPGRVVPDARGRKLRLHGTPGAFRYLIYGAAETAGPEERPSVWVEGPALTGTAADRAILERIEPRRRPASCRRRILYGFFFN